LIFGGEPYPTAHPSQLEQAKMRGFYLRQDLSNFTERKKSQRATAENIAVEIHL
jgi:hypothetical protein